MIFVPAALLIPLAFLFMSGDATCPRVPTMTWAQACLKTTETPLLYNLCGEILQHAPDTAEATVYALIAAVALEQSYVATTNEAQSQLIHGSPSGDEKAALQRCIYKSSKAAMLILDVIKELGNCQFKNIAIEYVEADSMLISCTDALSKFPNSPVLARTAAANGIGKVTRRLAVLVIYWLQATEDPSVVAQDLVMHDREG
ncbi:hypothetical protein QOZ80_8AG0616950 [Eleusine coracana subsp. coracana]|nr:hypothetical protein QOZ80_8AG0616950 [Eleusine coracana subsp. coracana]